MLMTSIQRSTSLRDLNGPDTARRKSPGLCALCGVASQSGCARLAGGCAQRTGSRWVSLADPVGFRATDGQWARCTPTCPLASIVGSDAGVAGATSMLDTHTHKSS
jgi:hypothetical protein